MFKRTKPKVEAGTKPFWTRAKVGTSAGVAGLLLGIGLGGAGEPALNADMPEVKTLISDQVQDQTDHFDEETQELRDQVEAAQKEAAEAAAEAERKLVAAQEAATQAQDDAVRKAVADEKAKQSDEDAPLGFANTDSLDSGAGGSDPLFDTCGEANDNGYGNYKSGRDPEYGNYQDRDGDGVVCEF
jgi:hypothetical protein